MHEEQVPTRRELLADWTRSAAKFVAIGLLGLLSAVGISSSLLGRQPRPDLVAGRDAGARTLEDGGKSVGIEKSPSHPASHQRSAAAIEPPSISQPLDLNLATAKELETLPGIGPALAARIIEDREKFGAYETVEQLDRVRGIGPKLMEKLRPLVRIRTGEPKGPATTDDPDNPGGSEEENSSGGNR